MSAVQIITLVLAVLNLVFISLAVYYEKKNLALGLAFVEIILVAIGSTVN